MSENVKPSKGEQSRLNILYIIFTLKKYSNEQHPLSVNEITKHINQDYAHFSTMEQLISPDTVKRTLDMLTSYFFDTSEPEITKKRDCPAAISSKNFLRNSCLTTTT